MRCLYTSPNLTFIALSTYLLLEGSSYASSQCSPTSVTQLPFAQTAGEEIELTNEDYKNFAGDYCEAYGGYQSFLAPEKSDKKSSPCTLKFSENGVMSLEFFGANIAVNPSVRWKSRAYMPGHSWMAGNNSIGTFENTVTGRKFATIMFDRDSIVSANISIENMESDTRKQEELYICNFKNTSILSKGIPKETVFHAYPGDIQPSMVGTFLGTVEFAKDDIRACSATLNAYGDMRIETYASISKTSLSAYAKLDGDGNDTVSVSDGYSLFGMETDKVTAAMPDEPIQTVALGFSQSLTPLSASAVVRSNGQSLFGGCIFNKSTSPNSPSSDSSDTYYPPDLGKPACENTAATNPINTGTGNKFQTESDYVQQNSPRLSFSRFYNSDPKVMSTWIGKNWRTSFDYSIQKIYTSAGLFAQLHRPDGSSYVFQKKSNGYWEGQTKSGELTELIAMQGFDGGWMYRAPNLQEEIYDINGKIINISTYTETINFSYDDNGRLEKVSDQLDRQVKLEYKNNKIEKVYTPDGGEYIYKYDQKNNLIGISYPDSSSKSYLYEDTRYESALTGIIDENGNRYATWKYDANGRAISSEHANETQKYTVQYGVDYNSVTDPSGSTRNYFFKKINGITKYSGQSQPAGAGCATASRSRTYDGNGNVSTDISFKGIQTLFSFDQSRNLEISRTEAAGTPEARTISTEWHATFRLRTKVAEPKLLTTYTYDTNGNLLAQTEQATLDLTGAQGFTAQVSGSARATTYTYNEVGQVLTITGPRTDIVDRTTFTYDDATGNLSTVTNAAGHVTRYDSYDASGRPTQITEPNGIVTKLVYSPRGWLLSSVRDSSDGAQSETMSFTYTPSGQVKTVTSPDNITLAYTYDKAQRLTSISDNSGNTINYTLDNMGNRTLETISDASGTLARKITRAYDALNRLQKQTGGAQ